MASPRRSIAIAAALAAAALGVLLLRDRAPGPGGAGGGGAGRAAEGTAAAPAPVPSRLPISLPAPSGVAAPRDAALPASFEGRVVSRATGAGIPGADLTFARAGGATSVRAGPDGAFRFDPPEEGRWLLAAVTAPGFLPFAPEWGHSPVQLDARAGHSVRGLAVHLVPADEILGRVVDAEGRPAPGAEVRLLGAGGEAALVSIPDRFTAGENGEFRFAAPQGAVVEARRPGLAPGRARVDLVVALERRLTVALGPARPAAGEPGRIAGRVVERDGGAPLAGALVVAAGERGFAPPAAQVTAGADGAFELGGLDPGSYRLTARAEGHAPASASRVATGARDVLLALAPGGRLRGCVTDLASGAPVAPFTVLVFERRSPLLRVPQSSRSFVDASGCWALDDLLPGAAAVVVSAPGFAPSEEVAVEVPASGEAVADARLERGGRLIGIVRDAETGAPLEGARLSVEGLLAEAASTTIPVLAEATTDAAGRFALEGLPRVCSIVAAAAGHHGRVLGRIRGPARRRGAGGSRAAPRRARRAAAHGARRHRRRRRAAGRGARRHRRVAGRRRGGGGARARGPHRPGRRAAGDGARDGRRRRRDPRAGGDVRPPHPPARRGDARGAGAAPARARLKTRRAGRPGAPARLVPASRGAATSRAGSGPASCRPRSRCRRDPSPSRRERACPPARPPRRSCRWTCPPTG